ncbi:hypothetical protein [Anaerolentibacter hominis]|uniref:hypothetical protein n=1 Tax=Anaerolentibacter hominis TaxID=3079009 RepID=UPI0031B84CBF
MKNWKRLMALVLALVCVIMPIAPASAAEDTAPIAPNPTAGVQVVDENENAVTTLKPFVYTTGSDTDLAKVNKFGIILPAGMTEAVIPVEMSIKGILAAVYQSDVSASVDFYSDAACTQTINYSTYDGFTDVVEKGTYYLKVSTYSTTGCIVAVGLGAFSSGNKTIKSKTWYISAFADSSTAQYYKLSVSKQSKIVVETQGEYSRYITICDKNKKAVTEECYTSTDGKMTFVVPKGTYYVKVKSTDDLLRLRATVTALSDKTGTSKSKAKALKVNGSKVTGLVTTSDKTSKADWVKFTNPKNQKINVYITGDITSGTIEMEFFSSNGKSMGTQTVNSYRNNGYVNLYTIGSGYSGKTLAKGTYYIKITKDTKKTTGVYTIQVKNK